MKGERNNKQRHPWLQTSWLQGRERFQFETMQVNGLLKQTEQHQSGGHSIIQNHYNITYNAYFSNKGITRHGKETEKCDSGKIK